jgi:hypothetical protein
VGTTGRPANLILSSKVNEKRVVDEQLGLAKSGRVEDGVEREREGGREGEGEGGINKTRGIQQSDEITKSASSFFQCPNLKRSPLSRPPHQTSPKTMQEMLVLAGG